MVSCLTNKSRKLCIGRFFVKLSANELDETVEDIIKAVLLQSQIEIGLLVHVYSFWTSLQLSKSVACLTWWSSTCTGLASSSLFHVHCTLLLPAVCTVWIRPQVLQEPEPDSSYIRKVWSSPEGLFTPVSKPSRLAFSTPVRKRAQSFLSYFHRTNATCVGQRSRHNGYFIFHPKPTQQALVRKRLLSKSSA